MSAGPAYPRSEARIQEMMKLVRQRRPLFETPLVPLPDNVGLLAVNSRSGRLIGTQLVERGAAGMLALGPRPQRKPKQGPRYPCEEKYRVDPEYKRKEARRGREKRMRKWLELAEVFLSPLGQWYLWEWRQRDGRKLPQVVRRPAGLKGIRGIKPPPPCESTEEGPWWSGNAC